MRTGVVVPMTLQASGNVEFYSVVVAGSANGTCKLPTGAKDPKIMGIMLPVFNKTAAVNGDTVDVQFGEITKFRKVSGETITNGDYLMPGDALGNLVTYTVSATEVNEYIGMSLSTLANTDLEGEMIVFHGQSRLPA